MKPFCKCCNLKLFSPGGCVSLRRDNWPFGVHNNGRVHCLNYFFKKCRAGPVTGRVLGPLTARFHLGGGQRLKSKTGASPLFPGTTTRPSRSFSGKPVPKVALATRRCRKGRCSLLVQRKPAPETCLPVPCSHPNLMRSRQHQTEFPRSRAFLRQARRSIWDQARRLNRRRAATRPENPVARSAILAGSGAGLRIRFTLVSFKTSPMVPPLVRTAMS